MMKKTLIRRKCDEAVQVKLGLLPLLNRIYGARGISDPNQLERSLTKLIPFHSLSGIEQAVDRLILACKQQESVMIIGDFDADGATSTAVAVAALQSFGFKTVNYIVPNRFEFGYGLSPEIVEEAAKQSPDLIITVDNGIANCDGVDRANSLGIEVLITDHHLAGHTLPDAVAIVNPNQPDDQFPSKNLAGVGVIFYVMLALRAKLRASQMFNEIHPEPNLGELLDLVALGTVADVVPLDQNNRIMVHQGLLRIRQGQCRPGIMALLEVAGRDYRRVQSSDLGFIVGPRLNAAGRLEDMSLGIACLLSRSKAEALPIAKKLQALNQERQSIETQMKKQAFDAVDRLEWDKKIPYGIALHKADWHQGVVGLVASRVKDRCHRPVVAFATDGPDKLKGSARSIPGIHIRDVLQAMSARQPDIMLKFGGHAMAAGLSIKIAMYPAFSKLFDQTVKKLADEQAFLANLMTDGELSESEFSLEIANLLRQSGPWGQHFPEPLFEGEFELLDQRLVGQKHLKVLLKISGSPVMLDGIAFGVDHDMWPNYRCKRIRTAYRLDVNHYQGQDRLQLCLDYLEPVS